MKNCEKLRKLNTHIHTHKTNIGEQFELCKTIEKERERQREIYREKLGWQAQFTAEFAKQSEQAKQAI